jgi:hypothetical protein
MVMQRIVVWVQFLKPCKAISRNDELFAKYGDNPIPNNELKDIFSIENMSPKYKCDYRTTVFVTFYNKYGSEMSTVSDQPAAPFGQDGKRKYEILPGEKRFVLFVVPSGAEYYYTWVPK